MGRINKKKSGMGPMAAFAASGLMLVGCLGRQAPNLDMTMTAPAQTEQDQGATPGDTLLASSRHPSDVPLLSRAPEWIEGELAHEEQECESCGEAEWEDGDKPEDPDGLARWRMAMRGGVDAIPANALMRAKEQAQRMPRLQVSGGQRDAGIWNWEWLGPGNIGGRSRSLLIHPTQTSNMWLGAVGGGIWKTTNGGGSWEPINDFLPALSVSCMAMDPNNPNIMYAGTGEPFAGGGLPGAGVFKSTDGGVTWPQLPDTIPTQIPVDDDPWAWIRRIAVAPLNSQIVLVANKYSLYRSINGGQDFDIVLREIVDDVKFRNNSNYVIAGTRDGVILKSSDAGASWSVAPVSGYLFTTLFRTNFTPDPGSGNDLIPVNSTAGFEKGDRIRLGIIGNGEYVTVTSEVTSNQWLEVSDVRNSYSAGTQIAMEAYPEVTQLDGGTSPDGNSTADAIDVDSTAGFYPGDRVAIYDGNSSETTTVQAIVDGNTLSVSDLDASHGNNSRVRSMRNGRVEVAWGPSSTCYASANRGGGAILRSNNSGDSFNPLDTTDDIPDYLMEQGNYDNTIWVSPTDSNFIVVGGIDLWRDDNTATGLNLTKISDWIRYHFPGGSAHADQHGLIAHPNFNGSSNKTVFVVNDGGVQRTPDITAIPVLDSINWVNLATSLGITQFYGGAAAPDGSVILGGAQDNGRLRYEEGDGTSGWFQCPNCTGDGGPCAVNPDDPAVLYTTTQNLTIWKSLDGGLTYLPAMIGIDSDEDTAFIAPFTMVPGSPDDLFAGGRTIYQSANGALSWDVIRSASGGGNSNCTALEQYGSLLLFAGYESGRVSKASKPPLGGDWTWTNLDNNGPDPLPNDRPVTDIAANGPGGGIFVTLGGYEDDSVWYTPDAGQSWENRHGNLPEVQINTITLSPSYGSWVYVGTDIGVFASEDLGQTWSAMPRYPDVGNEGPVYTEVQDLFWQGSHLIAATYGRGMYRVLATDTIYVDGLNQGCQDGTYGCPFNNVAEALENQAPGTDIVIEGNITYLEGDLLFQRRGEITAVNGDAVIQ